MLCGVLLGGVYICTVPSCVLHVVWQPFQSQHSLKMVESVFCHDTKLVFQSGADVQCKQ